MRKRKRDWPQRVLRYRVYPREIPQSVWDTARKQRDLWNNLTALWKAASAQARDESKEVSKPIWEAFNEWAKAAIAQSGLDWANGPDIFDRLNSGIRAKPPRYPNFHGGLRRISIIHRYTGGGKPLEEFVDNTRSKSFALQSSATWEPIKTRHSPKNKHWRGCFQIGEDSIDFAVALHRPLPDNGAIVKRVAWLGEYAGQQWFWYIAITVEEPPVPAISSETATSSAAIDLGWRLFADGTKQDCLRIGMLADTDGHAIELRLPLCLRPNRVAETRSFATVAELQTQASKCVEDAKAMLAAAFSDGEVAQIASNPKSGRRALGKALNLFELLNPMALNGAPTKEIVDKLRNLLDQHDRIYRTVAFLRYRLIQRRRWYFQNLALWLCQTYKTITLEDMNIAELHRKTDNPALQNAAQYRNYAAVGELRAYLKLAARKTGAVISEAETLDTTVKCWECGSESVSGAALELTCANGHQWDQDKNAAKNLLARADGTFGQPHMPIRAPVFAFRRLDIPERLRQVAVEVLA